MATKATCTCIHSHSHAVAASAAHASVLEPSWSNVLGFLWGTNREHDRHMCTHRPRGEKHIHMHTQVHKSARSEPTMLSNTVCVSA